jgi:hypothetical protein
MRPCKNMFAVSGQGAPTLRPRWIAAGRHLAGAHFLQGIRSVHVDLGHAVAEQSNGCIGSISDVIATHGTSALPTEAD